MKKYICTICGYIFDENEGVLWEELPDEWLCPLCGADKMAFKTHEENIYGDDSGHIKLNEKMRELKSMEFSVLCSNLAKGCEKQYLEEEANAFHEIGKYFDKTVCLKKEFSISDIVSEINNELDITFNESNKVVDLIGDRGAKRALVWSEKVTRMLQSVLNKYEQEGDSYIENTNVYVCEICGFVYIGDELPKVCPVCKVPNFKMKEIRRD